LPTPNMRRAMAEAEVGDDQYGEDPTVNRLERRSAEIVGKEAALYVASGMLGNLCGVLSQTERGDEVILGDLAHIYQNEMGASFVLGSIQPRLVRRAGRNHPIHDKETPMRFMVLVPGSPESEAGEMPSTEILGAMTKYNEELVKSGVMLAGEGLHPTSKGAKVRFNGSERTVIDGPFTEAKELVAGYWVWECASRDEAIEWLKRAPFDGGVEIELRQIFEAEDFGEQLTPELREANERLREQTAQN